MSKLSQLIDNQLEIENYNNDFLLIKSNGEMSLSMIGKSIYEQNFSFVRQVIVTEKEICLQVNKKFKETDIALLSVLSQKVKTVSKNYKLPVYFTDNSDWEEVERYSGFSKDEIIKQLTNQEFPVAMFGFLPGFIYLDGLDKSLHIPRKKNPAKYVEAGSIAIGGKYLGLYGLDSPGGWHVIGKMPASLLQIPNLPPLKINLKDTVSLYAIDKEKFLNYEEFNDELGLHKAF